MDDSSTASLSACQLNIINCNILAQRLDQQELHQLPRVSEHRSLGTSFTGNGGAGGSRFNKGSRRWQTDRGLEQEGLESGFAGALDMYRVYGYRRHQHCQEDMDSQQKPIEELIRTLSLIHFHFNARGRASQKKGDVMPVRHSSSLYSHDVKPFLEVSMCSRILLIRTCI